MQHCNNLVYDWFIVNCLNMYIYYVCLCVGGGSVSVDLCRLDTYYLVNPLTWSVVTSYWLSWTKTTSPLWHFMYWRDVVNDDVSANTPLSVYPAVHHYNGTMARLFHFNDWCQLTSTCSPWLSWRIHHLHLLSFWYQIIAGKNVHSHTWPLHLFMWVCVVAHSFIKHVTILRRID